VVGRNGLERPDPSLARRGDLAAGLVPEGQRDRMVGRIGVDGADPPTAAGTDATGLDAAVRGLNVTGGLVLGVTGLAALVAGSIGPWATALNISVSGTHGDGKLTLAAAAIALVALLVGRGGAVVALLVSLAALGISVYNIIHISHKAADVTFAGTQVASVGWGVYVAAVGAVLAAVGALAQTGAQRQASSGAVTSTGQ
jgi:hypothetical protein